MIHVVMVNFAIGGELRGHEPGAALPHGQSWSDDLWTEVARLVDAAGLGDVREWMQSLDWRIAVWFGVGTAILVLLFFALNALRRDEQRGALSEPRLRIPVAPASVDQDWVPDIAQRLGLKAQDRQGLVDGIERLRNEMQEMFDEFRSHRGAQTSTNAPPAPMWRRLLERADDEDTQSVTQSVTLERTYQALAVTMVEQLLDARAQDDRMAALDGYSGTTLKEAIAWWRSTIIADAGSAGGRAAQRVDETVRRMTQVILRSEIIARTYLSEENDHPYLAPALSSIAGAARQMLGQANWSFDRPALLAWQPSASMNDIQRSFIARPERTAGTRGAVTPAKSFYLQFLQRRARNLDSSRPVAVDIVEIGYRAPDGRWEPSRLVAYNPAEWM